MRLRPVAAALALVLASSGAAFAYSYAEVVAIYRQSSRRLMRDPKLAGAMRLLRESRVLYQKSADLNALAAQVERPEMLKALAVLHDAGLLPHASTTADTIHVEKDVLTTEPPVKRSRPIYRMGRVVKPIPFYELIEYKNYYILGGLLEAGAEFEVVTSNQEGVALISFEKRPPAYISMSHVDELAPPGLDSLQNPAGIGRKVAVGPATYYQAVHEYARGQRASLSILWVPLDRGVTVKPYVTSAYNRLAQGPTRVQQVYEMGNSGPALAAINGTFFINAPKTEAWGKPLGPILIDGRLAWSYNEPRVLKMNRAYLAITSDGRAVLGDSNQTGEELSRLNGLGRLVPGARVRDLLGGLGWLMRNGDEMAWQRYAGTQFWYTYYSNHTKRPQTVMAVTADGRALVLVAQEGLPHSSRPMSLPMLARYLKANFPVKDAVFLDGGGSTEMAISGRPVTRQEGNGAYRKNSTALIVVKG